MSNANKTTVIIDASSLKNSSCRLRFFNDVFIGYRGSGGLDGVMFFGSAFHHFRATYRTTNDWNKAYADGLTYFKNPSAPVSCRKKFLNAQFLSECMIKYEEVFDVHKERLVPVIDKSGDTLVEPRTRFALPFIITEDIDILIAGTMDEMAYQHASGYTPAGYRIVDCKTSGTWKIRDYMASYRLSPQLLMYRFAIKQYAKLQPDSIWADIDNSPTTAGLIEGVFYKGDDEGGKTGVNITRSDAIFFKPEMLFEFEVLLRRQCEKLIDDIRVYKMTGNVPIREGLINDSCSTKFGPCGYSEVCCAVDDEARESILEQQFIRKFYNPLAFN